MQINRLANNILQRVGPVVLGTVLNPAFAGGAARKTSADNDTVLPIDNDYESLPEELTNFKPEEDFDSHQKDN